MGRTLVIGDIHGGLKALHQIFDKANVTSEDNLIFLGDYVDGWSDSAATVSYLIELEQKQNCIFIRGNHDDLCFQWLALERDNPDWRKHGGLATMEGYQNFTNKEKRKHIKFYRSTRNYHVDDENRLFLHAGFTNLHGPHREYFPRLCHWDRTLWETALAVDPKLSADDIRYPQRLKLFKEIFIGHTPVTRINQTTPVQAQTVWNVDTGAAFKGPLTILDIDSKEYWQSDPVWQLYPDEQGRN